MPSETPEAIGWALQQVNTDGDPITKDSPHDLVDKVREYFNDNSIEYGNFSYDDLVDGGFLN